MPAPILAALIMISGAALGFAFIYFVKSQDADGRKKSGPHHPV